MHDRRETIYHNKPLSSPRDFRMLEIEPADDFESPIYCTLKVVPLRQKEKYQTLSYAWGLSPATKTIVCDEMSLAVTPTADLALRRIREKVSPKDIFFSAIWIDAICINQADDVEKSSQVAMMGEIYKASSRLVIWLGEADDSIIEDVKEALKRPKDPNSVEVLRALTQRPWFERLWVVRELFNSSRHKRHFPLGFYKCIWEILVLSCQAANLLEHSGPTLSAYMPPDSRHWSPYLIWSKNDQLPSMLENMIRFPGRSIAKLYVVVPETAANFVHVYIPLCF